MIIMTIKDELPLTEAKKHFLEIVRQVEAAGVEVALLRRGKPVAKIVPIGSGTSGSGGQEWADELRKLHGETVLSEL